MTECACDYGSYASETDWPADVSALLYRRLLEVGLGGRSVLEVGCGHGRLLVGALLAGAATATGVELDREALDGARARAADFGLEGRIAFLEGDGADLPLEPHDVVVLDRVICCDQAPGELVGRTVVAAGGVYAITVPESRGMRGAWNRVAYAALRAWDRITGSPDRAWVHDVRRMEARLTAAGFRLTTAEHLGKWFVGIYRRPLPGSRHD
ncbi:MAG: class I SAM-dependent methyltransferase [Candidatus Limnocylindria bacterium]